MERGAMHTVHKQEMCIRDRDKMPDETFEPYRKIAVIDEEVYPDFLAFQMGIRDRPVPGCGHLRCKSSRHRLECW